MRLSYNLLIHYSLIRATVFAPRSKSNLDYFLRTLYIGEHQKILENYINIKIFLRFDIYSVK